MTYLEYMAQCLEQVRVLKAGEYTDINPDEYPVIEYIEKHDQVMIQLNYTHESPGPGQIHIYRTDGEIWQAITKNWERLIGWPRKYSSDQSYRDLGKTRVWTTNRPDTLEYYVYLPHWKRKRAYIRLGDTTSDMRFTDPKY